MRKIYLILDEVQKSKDWKNRVKIFYDLHPNIKFIISGPRPLMLKEGPEYLLNCISLCTREIQLYRQNDPDAYGLLPRY